MTVYMTEHGKYFPVPKKLNEPRGLYINLTNRCNNDCPFCLREKKVMTEDATLWLEREPTVEEVISELEKVEFKNVSEVVFCGFGEPTIRLAEVVELLKYVKKIHPTTPIHAGH